MGCFRWGYLQIIMHLKKKLQLYKNTKAKYAMIKVNIKEKLQLITDYWKPIIVGELNNQQVKLVKIKGEFVMHKHDNEDELFFVVKGEFDMVYENRTETIKEGEFVIVPKGIKHKPVAKQEAHLLLFEPESVLNTGDVRNEFTYESPEKHLP